MGSRVEFGLGIGASMVSAGRVPAEPADNDVFSLVAAAREGDRSAFGHLYERYARMVHAILLGRVPVAEVEDLVQEFASRNADAAGEARMKHENRSQPSHFVECGGPAAAFEADAQAKVYE